MSGNPRGFPEDRASAGASLALCGFGLPGFPCIRDLTSSEEDCRALPEP